MAHRNDQDSEFVTGGIVLPDAPDGPFPTTTRKREAEEWVLVLTAVGFEPELRRVTPGGPWTLEVPPESEDEARQSLASWQKERREREARLSEAHDLPHEPTTSEMARAYALALSLLGFHLYLTRSGQHARFLELGDSQAALVLAGQLWRAVTALTLHADLSHVAGNTLIGGFFLAALAGRLGIGAATMAFLVSGTIGNLANAVYYSSAHSSVGASTGVFGLVGVLAGLAAWQRHYAYPPRRGAWIAFAAGLGIVSMLGAGGPRVDFSAHIFGLIAGALTGLAIAFPLAGRPRPGRRAQFVCAVLSLVAVLGLE